ncbi:hypothetical protein VCR15J2_470053 [Vibrio coralliirubri]|nr:hypothetical protein VCR15J2_470053 [Vibrio coralliirubri]
MVQLLVYVSNKITISKTEITHFGINGSFFCYRLKARMNTGG